MFGLLSDYHNRKITAGESLGEAVVSINFSSMGVWMDLLGGMLNRVDMKEGWEIWIVPWNQSQRICTPRNWLGSPRSWILKLPLMSCTIFSIAYAVCAARSPLFMYHPVMSSSPLVIVQKKMVVSASPGVKPIFCNLEYSVWCQTLLDCLSPYMLLLSLQTKFSFSTTIKLSGWRIYMSSSSSYPLRYAPLMSTCLNSRSFWQV